jgi:23S rRNA (adenine2030-N6)-methyltransferase
MLSYRHGFHAGNFADVFKHCLLVYLLNKLKKNKPFTFIDPFAAAGTYLLEDKFMQKNKEYLNGIIKVLNAKISDQIVNQYLDLVRKVNSEKDKHSISVYPGSCLLSSMVLDEEDKIYLSELHNNEFEILQKNFSNDSRIIVEKKDAYSTLNATISSYKGNRLVLIDPSYEVKDEYEKVVKLIKHNTSQFSDVCYMAWYPVLDSEKTNAFIHNMLSLKIKNMTHIKIELQNSFLRMQGTGFFIINAPSEMKSMM